MYTCLKFSQGVLLLQKTDISEHALEKLRESKVKHVYVIGRRGPLQVEYHFNVHIY